MLEVRLIGKFDVKWESKTVTITSRTAQSLFAYLILNAGTSYRREKLAGMFWPDVVDKKARAYLRHELWRLRKAIPFEFLLSDDMSIAFNSAMNYWLDSESLQKLGDTSSAQELINALTIYTGELLPGFYDDWIVVEREHLQAVYEQKMARLLEVLEGEKRWPEIIRWAERWISFGQGPEAAYRYLMIAYDAFEDRAKVTSIYQRCVQALRQFDLEPSEETRALAFKRSSKLNIPIPMTSFIGRENELKEVSALLSRSRLVTLTGSGGVGKTRLAIQVLPQVLDRFCDGVWLLDLAPLNDPVLIPNTLANMLGLQESGKQPVIDLLINYFRSRIALVIFDNCEHLIESCAQLIHLLLTSCEGLSVLATSREALRVAGEISYRVPSLTVPKADIQLAVNDLANMESVRLFRERAALTSPGFIFNSQNAFDIARICQRLDGIPLAIELAAARTNLLSVQQILTGLDDRFHLLTRGLRSSLPRHQTLRAMIEWSYELLTEKERILLRRLAVFLGGWTLEAVQQVCSGNGIVKSEVLDLLSQLVNKSQVFVENSNSETRYHRLESIRQFAREKLEATNEAEIIRQQHLAYYVDLAERAEPHLRSFDMLMWLDRLETELDNIRIALEYALESNIQAQLRLVSALQWFWWIRGHKNEGADWLEQGLSIEAAERGDQPLTSSRAMIRGKALNVSGYWLGLVFESGKAAARLEESVALFRNLGPLGKQGMAYALQRLAICLPGSGRSMFEQSLAMFREMDDKFGMAECLGGLMACVMNHNNDYEQALQFTEQQLTLRREIGDQDGIATALAMLGDLAFFSQDDYQKATELYEESVTIFRELGNKWLVSVQLAGYGDICLWLGNYEQAIKFFEEALLLTQEFGDKSLSAFSFYSLGFIAWFRGDHARATQFISDSLAFGPDIGAHWLVTSGLHALGDIALAEGDEKKATQQFVSELALSQKTDFNMSLVFAFCGLGKVAWAQSNYELATTRFEEALKRSREQDFKQGTFHALYGLGRVAQSLGDYAAARPYYAEMLDMQQQRIVPTYKWGWLKTYVAAISYPLEGFAILATAQNQMKRASRLLSAAENLYVPLLFEMSARERAEHDQAIATARAALGEEAFTSAYEQGKKMTLDEAIMYALEKQ